MPDDPIIYIILLSGGDVLAFRKREDAEAECGEDGEIKEAYLQ